MRAHNLTRYGAFAVLVGALACAGNRPETDTETEPDQAAAARDTTSDTTGVQNPPGYRGMERDTTIAPAQQPSDTFLQNQGVGGAQDTSGYSGMERTDTTGQANGQADPAAQTDTTGGAAGARDTSGARGADTSGVNQSGMDTTGTSRTGDTTGYDPSQQPSQDTTSSR
jgi:hypothetical protein